MARTKGGKRVVKLSRKKSNQGKEAGPKKRRALLGNPAKTGAKIVGRNKQFKFNYQHHYFRKKVGRRDFESAEFEADLLPQVKTFRKKTKTTKTRTIAKIRFRHRGKYFDKDISIGRAEFGDVGQRVTDTMKHFRRMLSHYARQGFKFVRLKRLQLGRVTKTAKAKKTKRSKRK